MESFTLPSLTTTDVLSHAAQPMSELSGRFADMMSRVPTLSPLESGETTPVGEVLLAQDNMMRKASDDMSDTSARINAGEGDSMSNELKIQMLWQLANSQVHFQACASLGQNVKNGVQTLMRTQ